MGYGKSIVLHNINLTVHLGEFLSIFGENGAGKTTLFKGILQLLPIQRGEITILGKDVTNGKDKTWLRSQIGYVPQKHNSGNFPICVFDAVLLGRWGTSFSYFKRPSKDDKRITDEILEVVGLTPLKYQDCRKLSGGQTQRLNIARALVRQPKILLLDEPTTHLDIDSQKLLDDTLTSIRQQYNLSILMISHNQHHARRISDRVVYLEKGRIIDE
jgi:ABC-type cobalamin/Fe3+-siderophores transport system ATPase subunit